MYDGQLMDYIVGSHQQLYCPRLHVATAGILVIETWTLN
jgi:hypothetical protein